MCSLNVHLLCSLEVWKVPRQAWTYFYHKPWRNKHTTQSFIGQSHYRNCILIWSITIVYIRPALLFWLICCQNGDCNTWLGIGKKCHRQSFNLSFLISESDRATNRRRWDFSNNRSTLCILCALFSFISKQHVWFLFINKNAFLLLFLSIIGVKSVTRNQ